MTQNKVQTGPAYVCPGCGRAIDFIRWGDGLYMQPNWNNPLSRDWEQYVFYMHHVESANDKTCKENLRVVRLGDCVLPVVFASELTLPDYNERIHDTVRVIRNALEEIAREVCPEERVNDTASKVVYGLMAGRLTPDAALSILRDNVQHTKALLVVGETTIAVPDDLALKVEKLAESHGQTIESYALMALRQHTTPIVSDWLETELNLV